MTKGRMTLVMLLLGLFLTGSVDAQIRDHSTAGRKTSGAEKGKPKPQNGFKPFKELIKDKVVTEGLFTFYRDTSDNSVLMKINPDQIGPYFLCDMAKSAADGSWYDTGPMGRSFPFYFRRVGKNIQMVEKNLMFRADSASTMSDAVSKGISDHLFAAMPIKSEAQDSTKAILVDPDELFVRDADNVGYFLGQGLRLGVSFDAANSYYGSIKSFPENSELDVKLHFRAGHDIPGLSLQNGQSFFHTYHYSLSSLPKTDYVPRLGDDRIGLFETIYQDYTKLDTPSPYVRVVQRWNLKKKNPDARISEPVKPIVFWIDRDVPLEYRDAIAEAIEFWNSSFEKIGFRNAVVAEQMPDTATWDPLDVRYNTIRWMVSPGRYYAIGPNRANPFTGEVYDADISISVDLMRVWFNLVNEWVKPIGPDGQYLQDQTARPETNETMKPVDPRRCTYAEDMAENVSFGLSYLLSTEGTFANKDSLTREYVHSALVEFIAHEVGHTLGLAHNFKASSVYSLEQLRDRDFTRQNSTSGTIMDYNPPLISRKGTPQGEFFASVPGPYDNLAIEYAYSEFGNITPDEEEKRLKEIASRTSEPVMAFATDFDLSAYSVDPLVERHDMGNDPIAFCDLKINLTQDLWNGAIKEFEKPGVSYERIRQVFMGGWRSYNETARNLAHYIGGLYHSKAHVGDPGGQVPFTPVPASEQKRAVKFLADRIFAPDAFNLPPELLNKLQSTQTMDFEGLAYISPIAFPWYERVLNVQATAINNLYHPLTLQRLVNSQAQMAAGDPKYTMYDLFSDVRKAIWGEVLNPANVNSYRRQLQLAHLRRIISIYLSNASVYPSDALTLAANDLDVIYQAARSAAASNAVDGMSKAHFNEVTRQIEAARSAQRDYFGY